MCCLRKEGGNWLSVHLPRSGEGQGGRWDQGHGKDKTEVPPQPPESPRPGGAERPAPSRLHALHQEWKSAKALAEKPLRDGFQGSARAGIRRRSKRGALRRMSIEITDDLVKHVARLSRLGISSEETKAIKSHFQKILAYISAFQSLETKDVDPTFFSLESSNVYREDELRASLPVEEALKNAPETNRPYFVVPRIVGDA